MTKQPKTIQEMMTLLVEERGLISPDSPISAPSSLIATITDCPATSEPFRLILLMAIIAFEMERTLRIS